MENNENTLDINDKEMKYIKWPKKKKVFGEMLSVLIGTLVLVMLIAAGDEIGLLLLNMLL